MSTWEDKLSEHKVLSQKTNSASHVRACTSGRLTEILEPMLMPRGTSAAATREAEEHHAARGQRTKPRSTATRTELHCTTQAQEQQQRETQEPPPTAHARVCLAESPPPGTGEPRRNFAGDVEIREEGSSLCYFLRVGDLDPIYRPREGAAARSVRPTAGRAA